VQIDCRLADVAANLEALRRGTYQAAARGARLVIFPECALTGYCFESREEALEVAVPLPGPVTEALAEDCRALGVFVIAGTLERTATGELFNSALIVGPGGYAGSYRKIHLPFLGVDRFATPGDRPFAVHDLDGLRVGINICYDGSFPESARVLTVLGADLVVLPTNWPTGARPTVQHLVQARALENHIYYAAVNRVGQERGFHFIGASRVVDCDGELLTTAGETSEVILAEIDPAVARNKRLVKIPGRYELDRVGHRRPEMYGPLVTPHERDATSPAAPRPS
jgi:predicted amidohydrolase